MIMFQKFNNQKKMNNINQIDLVKCNYKWIK